MLSTSLQTLCPPLFRANVCPTHPPRTDCRYDAGYRHFHLDDCWAGGRNESGYLYAEKDHFPNGMAPVVEYAHSKDLTFGLYTCAGTETCVGGRPGSKDHWTQDANVFAEWHVDVVKMDWCNTQGMHPQIAYKQMSDAMNATGRRMHLNMCEWGQENPWEWGGAIAQSWRMSGDHTGRWTSTKKQIELSAAIPAQYTGKEWGWNDMDMLETGNYEQAAHANGKESNMTSIEYKTEFSMWAISASPLVVTTPIMNCSNASGKSSVVCKPWISELQKEILLNKEVLAINQDPSPQGRPVVDGDRRIWTRKLANGDVALALYNEEDKSMTIGPFALSRVHSEWGGTSRVRVRDLWRRGRLQDDPMINDGMVPPVVVAPHETKLYRLSQLA